MRYKYKVVGTPLGDLQKCLDRYAVDGWRLVQIVANQQYPQLILERKDEHGW